MNGEVCCILAVCCPANSEKQRKALANEMAKALNGNPEDTQPAADWILENFDLAPAGSLTNLKTAVADLARNMRVPPPLETPPPQKG